MGIYHLYENSWDMLPHAVTPHWGHACKLYWPFLEGLNKWAASISQGSWRRRMHDIVSATNLTTITHDRLDGRVQHTGSWKSYYYYYFIYIIIIIITFDQDLECKRSFQANDLEFGTSRLRSHISMQGWPPGFTLFQRFWSCFYLSVNLHSSSIYCMSKMVSVPTLVPVQGQTCYSTLHQTSIKTISSQIHRC